MKLLIVDDEKHVREAVKMLVGLEGWQFDAVLEASNGKEACQLVERERPEIVLTDMMMPNQNGVQLLEWLKRHHPRCRPVVISGYKNYEFMRSTIQYGGLDYILKPIQPNQLREVIQRAIANWQEEEQRLLEDRIRNVKLHRIKPLYRDKLFSDLLKEGRPNDKIAEELGLNSPGNPWPETARVCVLSTDLTGPSVRQKFGQNRDLLGNAVTYVCEELLENPKNGVVFRNLNREGEIVLLLWSGKRAIDQVAEFDRAFRHIWGGSFLIGIGGTRPFPSGVPQSYTEARTSLRRKNMLQPGQWLLEWSDQAAGAVSDLPLDPDGEQLLSALYNGNRQLIRAVVKRWAEKAAKKRLLTLEQLELWWHELRILLTRWLRQAIPHEPIELPFEQMPVPLDDRGALDVEAWTEEWVAYIGNIANRFGGERTRTPDIMEEISRFLERHYTDDITLQDLSDRFFLSREYISRKFKQRYRTNIFEYIGRIRIEKAKLLLLDPEWKISQIARAVGYEDEKYFSKVFKRLVGVSPNDYRKMHTNASEWQADRQMER